MDATIEIRNIENLKTASAIKVEKDKDGETIDRRLVTKIQFEAEVEPAALSNIHRLLAEGVPVHVAIGSTQAIMNTLSQEHAFVEA